MRTLGSPDIIYILMAVRWTLLLSLVAFLGGALGGALVALARTGEYKWLRVASAGYIKVFQGTPLLMQLFLAFFVPGLFGWSVDPWTAAALGLSLHASAFLGEIWRGAIEVVPRGQWEAATSLGLRYAPKMVLIIAPQAIRIAIPPTIGFLVQLIKGTSLASIIGFVELTRAAQIINNATFRPFTIFALVALVYYVICRPLSAYSKRMEQKLLVAAR
ncbi:MULTISPECIES: amino acid ABC transporter permease [Bosea]|jgi:polar amino acid transport system permease protein|uniref:amino acid ABC transporter permease n=1 Tax=Bosea TaxID=85413 RepID=UPI002150311D|nr:MULTISPECIES: amino acid ABC transporter permease [Bosea]MCR4520294.1 amino acid ABC transporter permease [Bosea sp. 47.2.35]MDR6828683.1 polar amino acid transport system permease protein [Bosea robiniae]MDR6895342.1 polar amino acid transport system permease protein [Bosea sp. BE109]MDR7138738.1 polar amino acid transport system permease protein [Bosea sp. BE168]MDR7175287.1 polar amino acid transport system permease protein [Bosea sp. BE271]